MSAPRLGKDILLNPPAALSLPGYPLDKPAHSATIVHLGVGAFHRAHQALYTDTVLAATETHWRIIGASLRSQQVQLQLAPQDYLYTVVERDNNREQYRLVAAIDSVIVAGQNPKALISAMSDPACKIISLTITEKGYCYDAGAQQLDLQHPDIQHDLKHPASPRSAPGFIVAALMQRYQSGHTGLAIMSCDNLPANGQLTRQVILDLARQSDHALALWIEQAVSFPGTMVDRIVPATSAQDRQQLEQALGYRDEAMVVCEPFSQWVLEDNFIQGRPAWEQAGALFVEDVHAFETMKLRLLNGSHSTLAYLGYLAGYQTIDAVMADPDFATLVRSFMDREITPTLVAPEQIDLDAYKAQLLERFRNSALQHQTSQIAMDGSQKLPQRLLQPLEHQLLQHGSIDVLCLAVAAWIRYTMGVDEKGSSFTVADPLAKKLQLLHQQPGNSAGAILHKVFTLKEVFPAQLCQNSRFVDKCCHYLNCLLQHGSKKTVQAVNQQIGM